MLSNELPNVSFVIPTRNNASTIEQCLSSLLPYYERGHIAEIVIVDGLSSDNTVKIAKKYPAMVLSDEGKGFNVACDIGWRNSTGQIVIFFDADAYLAEGFFPRVYEVLSDDNIGVAGCEARAVVTGPLTKTIGQEWQWVRPGVGTAPRWLRRLYDRFAMGETEVPPGGPCQIVRRACLEAVGGFAMTDTKGGEDIYLSKRIIQQGWKSTWWLDAPVYHYPRNSLRSMMREFHRFGREEIYREEREQPPRRWQWNRKSIGILAHLGSPMIGLMLAIRFRNPMHLVVYSLPRYAWVWGYIQGWVGARKV